MSCPDEADFQVMYELRGNREAQERVRQEHPDSVHCPMLQTSPNACDGCPKNPMEGKRTVNRKLVDDHEHVIEWAITLGNYADMGTLPDISRLRPQEAIAAQIGLVHKRLAEQKQNAKLAASELAKVLAPMFGIKLLS